MHTEDDTPNNLRDLFYDVLVRYRTAMLSSVLEEIYTTSEMREAEALLDAEIEQYKRWFEQIAEAES